MESHGGMVLTGKPEELGGEPVTVVLCPSNPTWADPGANPGFLGNRLPTDRLVHGTANVLGSFMLCVRGSIFTCVDHASG
jgi:hypothetical protein